MIARTREEDGVVEETRRKDATRLAKTIGRGDPITLSCVSGDKVDKVVEVRRDVRKVEFGLWGRLEGTMIRMRKTYVEARAMLLRGGATETTRRARG